ncbi:MAG: exo-alpha-sialidase [Gemmatimonadaceae bacterium]|nr:exo-alpha-sialidase [Gemmatimonadaceae bacterium]
MRRLIAAVAATSIACAGRPDVTLQPEEVLTAGATAGAAPMFAVAPSGARTVAWVSAPDRGSDGRLFTSTAGAEPSELQDPLGGIEAHGESPPKLTYAPDGTLHALYVVGKVIQGRRFPFSTLRLVSSHDGGATWSAPATVTGDSVLGSRNFHAMHAAADGTIYVAWLESRDNRRSGTFITRSTDGGATWSQAVRADSTESCPCCRTAIASATDGTLYLAWRTVMPGNVRDIVVAASKDHGATWSPAQRVHADGWVFDGCPHAGPALHVGADGAVHVAWWTGKEGAAGVFYAKSTDGAQTFLAPVALGTAAFSRPAHVQLALDGPSTVVAAWDDGRDTIPRILVRVSRDGGATFGEAVTASDATVAASFPVLAVRDSAITVAWSQQSKAAMDHAANARPNMKDPHALMPLPVVGDQRVVVRRGKIQGRR